jgi:acetyltransferase-like isoleucine patch superfamily enzyme
MGFLSRLLLKLIDGEELQAKLSASHIAATEKKLTKPASSKIYSTTHIDNLQRDPKRIVLGENCHVRGNFILFRHDGKISMGDNCFVGERTNIWSAESVTIGNNVLISHEVNIVDTNSHELDAKERAASYVKMIAHGHSKEKGNVHSAPIVIKDYAWISFGAIILKGVTIGEGAIVAAGSVVVNDVPDYCVVAGNPAVIVKELHKTSKA